MQTELKYVIFKIKWGFFGLLADKQGLLRASLAVETFLTAKKYLLVGMFGPANEDKKLYPELQEMIRNYYKGSCVDFSSRSLPPIHWNGSVFAKKILQTCMKIPVGKIITYRQLAARAGSPNAARAAGSVLAKNPLPLIIPCHRVVRSDGKIGNFSAPGGGRIKKKMLEHEKRVATKTQRHKVF